MESQRASNIEVPQRPVGAAPNLVVVAQRAHVAPHDRPGHHLLGKPAAVLEGVDPVDALTHGQATRCDVRSLDSARVLVIQSRSPA